MPGRVSYLRETSYPVHVWPGQLALLYMYGQCSESACYMVQSSSLRFHSISIANSHSTASCHETPHISRSIAMGATVTLQH